MKGKRFVLTERTQTIFRIEPFSYRENTSIGTGGVAQAAFFPRKFTELCTLTDECRRQNIPFVVLGNATNVLAPDGENEKVVIVTARLNTVFVREKVFAAAGASLRAILDVCEAAGKTGAEFLEGIPGTFGGAAYMNAGANGKSMDGVLDKLLVYKDGKIRSLRAAECEYGYKTSLFMRDDCAILGGSFLLTSDSSEAVKEKRKEQRRLREKLPKGRSMGCVFKNPTGASAGKYIDGAGLKGMRIGGARVSNEHANFIVNESGATSEDVKRLILFVKNAVKAQYGVELEEEIRYL